MGAGIGHTRKRPFLLILVYAASLSLVALSCAALTLLGAQHVTTSGIGLAVSADQSAVRDFVATNLTSADLESAALPAERATNLNAALATLVRRGAMLDVSVLTSTGGILLQDRPHTLGGVGEQVLQRALNEGVPDGNITTSPANNQDTPASVLTESLPVIQDGQTRLVFVVRRDAAPILENATATWWDVLVVTLTAAVVLAGLLYAIFRAASARLRRQEADLAEAQRRDQLTGFLNHGSVMTILAQVVEEARADSSAIGVALVDVDNFRLLNDVHGDEAGDQALRCVSEALEAESEAWTALGRYGPDEFLAVAPASSARALEHAITRVRARLERVTLQFGSSERLPLTISAGVSYFPFHAHGVTDLLAAATIALGEAKASGGDDVRIADAWTDDPQPPHTTFDVLQGLVFAVDTKDRYTKRHSEDVATYALYLAERIGAPAELRETLRIAGLLHDVGKIGIPDDILRKPGQLTPYEYEVVKQHVALGDLIVRDLPNIELVRAGIRHHHERWDGDGYMDRLAGDQIPEIARILAVADAFSAMTTTRPYRKAFGVEDALDLLREAAGTQLDATLVSAFVHGIEHDPAAPFPGSDHRRKVLWTPDSRAA